MNLNQKIYSVSEITNSIKNILETEYRFISINGEISNFSKPFSGHIYFTLKDHNSQINCVFFKGQQKFSNTEIKDGLMAICHGRLTVYEPRGNYQLIIDNIEEAGAGKLYRKLEKLKKQLQHEGLFDLEKKQTIREYPQKIALITSPNGAAVHDFLKIWKLRKSATNILIIPVSVQGGNSASEIIDAISYANNKTNADTIVLARGGGSIEDLWTFNEEAVAHAIYNSKLPIITGIGHESDLTIADLCADLRAPTPTGAAEHIIPDKSAIINTITQLTNRAATQITHKLEQYSKEISYQKRLLGDMDFALSNPTLKLDYLQRSLVENMTTIISTKKNLLSSWQSKLYNQSPDNKINEKKYLLENLEQRLKTNIKDTISTRQNNLSKQAILLDAVSPLATLGRGYSVAIKGKKKIITKSSDVKIGEKIKILLKEGKLDCKITDKTNL